MITARLQWSSGALLLAVLALLAGCSQSPSSPPLSQSAANAPMLIEPNRGVGPIRAGMTPVQVIALLGEPDLKLEATLEYSRLGLAVKAGADGRLASVMCGDVVGATGPFVKAFNGRTKEGIGMLSTREDVIKAFGEPSATKKTASGLEWLQYDGQGITFSLEGGKVHHLIVRLGPAPEPDRSVLLQPAPADEKK